LKQLIGEPAAAYQWSAKARSRPPPRRSRAAGSRWSLVGCAAPFGAGAGISRSSGAVPERFPISQVRIWTRLDSGALDLWRLDARGYFGRDASAERVLSRGSSERGRATARAISICAAAL